MRHANVNRSKSFSILHQVTRFQVHPGDGADPQQELAGAGGHDLERREAGATENR
jgi:hypothetical protein